MAKYIENIVRHSLGYFTRLAKSCRVKIANGTKKNGELNSPKSRKFLIVWNLAGILNLLLLIYCVQFLPFRGSDAPKCQHVMMYPSYAKITGFDERYTPLAKKYHLYLYREQGLDTTPDSEGNIILSGIPVLFIPGNAGSYKQARSIASECSNVFYKYRELIQNPNTESIDFFTADFNEDLTAFHGQTMLDQAEYINDAIRYILSLYHKPEEMISNIPLPGSVIIVGHSMGGMVAKILPTLSNHDIGSIQSIITLSTPHATAPVTFDADILKLYQRVNTYWKELLGSEHYQAHNNVSIISITGGILDNVLPADYAYLGDQIPPTHGFTTYTTSIQNVWTSVDHLAVVWCRQLRNVIARALLETINVNSSHKVLPLEERMEKFRELLLPGIDSHESSPKNTPNFIEDRAQLKNLSSFHDRFLLKGEQLILAEKNMDYLANYTQIAIPSNSDPISFSIITTLHDLELHLCEHPKGKVEDSAMCRKIEKPFVNIPMSMKGFYHPADSLMDDNKPLKLLELNSTILSKYGAILIKTRGLERMEKNGFLIAKIIQNQVSNVDLVTPWKLALFGHSFVIRPHEVSSTVNFPNLWDSLVCYKLSTKRISMHHVNSRQVKLAPLLRQWIDEPQETKWHTNIANRDIDIIMHNIAPFIPRKRFMDRPLKLSFFKQIDDLLEVNITVNWLMTMKMLFIRYRLAVASFPIFFIALVMALQFYKVGEDDYFMSFTEAARIIVFKLGNRILLFLLILSPLLNLNVVKNLLYRIDPVGLTSPFSSNQNTVTNCYFLGIEGWFMAGLGVFFILMTVALLCCLYSLFEALEKVIKSKVNGSTAEPDILKKNIIETFNTRRLALLALMFIAVYFYIPYQLAFMVLVLIQVATCLKIAMMPSTMPKRFYSSLRNYNFTLLLLFLFVTVIDAPIIVVFMRNLLIKWETTFRSHHNFLAVLPMILLITGNTSYLIPTFGNDAFFDKSITLLLFIYLSFFSLIYGMRNLYWIHHLVNIISAWLFYGTLKKAFQENR